MLWVLFRSHSAYSAFNIFQEIMFCLELYMEVNLEIFVLI